MKKLNSAEIKEIDLQILLAFSEYCEKEDLTYYLVGGTLLGAIRHKGFIPWDDDVDVGMPRKDFERLAKEFPELYKGRYELRCADRKNMIAPFAQIIDTFTKVSSDYTTAGRQPSLWIDIFPVDGLPDDMEKVAEIYKRMTFYRKLLEISKSKYGTGKTFFRRFVKLFLKPATCLIGARRLTDKMNKIALTYPYDQMNHVGIITYGMYGVGERMEKAAFERKVEVEFENHKLPTFSCWDSYLKGIYGDYMTLPPVEKRKTHDMEAYLINEDRK